MVRIIAGEFKGFKLKVPGTTNKIRPTSDRVKEAVFSMIGERINGAVVLDLFCGSGNLGLEAVSRGAESCCFIEQNAVCVEYLKQNIAHLHCEHNTTVLRGECGRLLHSERLLNQQYNIVFADPPYSETYRWFSSKKEGINILNILIERDKLTFPALFILEHMSGFSIPEPLLCCSVMRKKKYGSTGITILDYNPV
ncbi:16S rRNA (guanine(966)-N(2))-methyltransferase RsmD [bacterium]|nr:16S rRNA (guanine(966)-N(2))-methyltransferase RsmD [bacterium]MCP5462492.1 16S rRNA (guanine(966)-N(2))-methyltransferase RsmD [bacterium]